MELAGMSLVRKREGVEQYRGLAMAIEIMILSIQNTVLVFDLSFVPLGKRDIHTHTRTRARDREFHLANLRNFHMKAFTSPESNAFHILVQLPTSHQIFFYS